MSTIKSYTEKAKRYDKAIERAKSLLSGNQLGNAWIYKLLPELKESEGKDEKIRKALIRAFKSLNTIKVWNGIERTDILAWLEKQGKNNMGISEVTKQKLEDNLNKALEKETPESLSEFLDEQKPVWSEEDEEIYRKCICAMRASACGFPEEEKFVEQVDNWLKSLKDKVQPQPRQKWSEEDENIRLRLIDYLYGKSRLAKDREDGISWLKSLRPQNNITDEELAQAKKNAYNDALDKIEYHSDEPTFDDGWNAAIWFLKKRLWK